LPYRPEPVTLLVGADSQDTQQPTAAHAGGSGITIPGKAIKIRKLSLSWRNYGLSPTVASPEIRRADHIQVCGSPTSVCSQPLAEPPTLPVTEIAGRHRSSQGWVITASRRDADRDVVIGKSERP
jgi:hypothetical protein